MSIIEDLKKIERWEISFATLAFLATIGPGLLTIYIFRGDLLVSLSVVILILLAGAITVPIFLANMTIISWVIILCSKQKRSSYELAFTLLWCSAFVLYGALTFTYLLGLSFKQHLLVICIFEIVAIILVALISYFGSRIETKPQPDSQLKA